MVAGSWRPNSIETPGTRFAVVHGANAGRDSRRHTGNRRGRRKKCRTFGSCDSRHVRRRAASKVGSISQKAGRRGLSREIANVKTVISTDRDAAVELLRKGELVALPTETVYGL